MKFAAQLSVQTPTTRLTQIRLCGLETMTSEQIYTAPPSPKLLYIPIPRLLSNDK